MQFFGGRVNLAKALLYAINGGRDEITGKQVGSVGPSITAEVLNYDEVLPAFEFGMIGWLASNADHTVPKCAHNSLRSSLVRAA